jgi:MFS family permease
MNFKKVNNITGWIICFIASLVYILTAEANSSFWDTGEFIASAYKLQLPHPPGAPVFTLLGRFFIILFGAATNPAFAVNIMSAVASGFTILFLFWTITHFARKLLVGFNDMPTLPQTFTIMAAGIVGGLAYTFSDSFWYSAVEGEVYALSSFFTALVFWAILKWEHADYAAGNNPILKKRADRWIIFIFFMMGLSIGVHLLNLLTIPAIVMIYYYKRYNYSRKGAIFAFIIGCIITGIVQVAVIQWTIKLAGRFDILFVNSFGLPFFSGFVFFFILLSIAIWFGLRFARQKGYSFLQLGLWSFIFMLIGYSMYVTTLLRSNANPSIDMNNVDNPMSLVYYLGREQYGSAPLLYGPHFQAEYERDATTGGVKFNDGEMKYSRGKEAYIPIGKQQEPEFSGSDKQIFPRVWDRSNEQGHADFYADWLNLSRNENQQTGEVSYEAPSYADNINWFVTYQMGFMYWRYFMWNFAGKQNDVQGFGSKRDGNWITGVPVIDNVRLGDQSMMPESLRKNKANNKLFLLPFVLGILGCVYHYLKDRRDWIVTFLLFSFTGLAIVLYLNQPGNQPRERDYAFAGSFYAFSIWIGLSVIALVRMAKEREDKQTWLNTLLYGSIGTFVIGLLSNTTTTFSGALISSILMAVIYAVVVAILGYAVKAASGKNFNLNTATATAFALCMITPIVMATQEWDDHDRSKKTLAPAMARNYLMALAPNAIIFTFGDNDTYPLWFAQEVENVRPDLRIVNTSLLGIDWYVNQLRYKLNESPPFDLIWSQEQIAGLSYIRFRPQGPQDRSYPLYDVMKNVIGPALNVEDKANLDVTYPVKRFRVPVDTAAARNFSLNPNDRILPEFEFSIPEGRNYLTLDQLTMLNIIASTNWQRPIYFTSSAAADQLGFGQYLRKEGLSLRLVPAINEYPQQNWLVDQALRGGNIKDNNLDVMYRTLMNDFGTGGANKPGVYFDEENRRHLLSVRAAFAEGAGNLSDKGRKPEAIQLLDRAESLIHTGNMPYAMASRYNSHNQTGLMYLEAAYKAGHMQLANKVRTAILKDLNDQKAYYDYMKNEKEAFYNSVSREADINNFLFQLLEALDKNYNPTATLEQAPGRAADSTELR